MPFRSLSRSSSPIRVHGEQHKQLALTRNQSVCEHSHAQPHIRRTKSFSLSDDVVSVESTPNRIVAKGCEEVDTDDDNAIRDLFHSRNKLAVRSRGGGPLSLITGLFSCWHPKKSQEARVSASKKVAALLEISKKQQTELADKQDTIDVLEWQLEQMQALESMEQELEPSRRSTASANGLGVIEGDAKREACSKEGEAMKEAGEEEAAEKGNDLICIQQQQQTAVDRGGLATLSLFEMATIRARFSVRSFCKALIKQIEASGYSVLKALMEIEPEVAFTRKEHVVYALESRINRAFFHGFENDNFDSTGIMHILDPVARCAARLEEFQRLKLVEVDNAVNSSHPAFNEEFRRFCERKTRELWSQFSWNIVFNSTEERDVFTAAFLDAAKGVWLLHRLAFSLNPHVVILRVGKGLSEIDPVYVDAVPELPQGKPCPKCSQLRVEFLIMPGFRAMDKVIKCQVYQHVQC